jgi:predicted SAM-dependent methyltransferase
MNDIVKLNLGCSTHYLSDWVNIDNDFNARLAKIPKLRYLLFKLGILPKRFYEIEWEKHVKNVRIRNLRKELPFPNESVDYIFSSHMLEHLYKDDAARLLAECYRVLKKGGLICIVVPDLQFLAERYLENIAEGTQDMKTTPSDEFLEMLSFCQGQRTGLVHTVVSYMFGSPHRWMWDQISLTKLLTSSGFIDVQKKSYKEGEMPDIDYLDNRATHSLYMEAKKSHGSID